MSAGKNDEGDGYHAKDTQRMLWGYILSVQ